MDTTRTPHRNVERPSPAAPMEALYESVYTDGSPRWRRYYKAVRSSIRFPRYYKRELNW
jgi:hypothetical protein